MSRRQYVIAIDLGASGGKIAVAELSKDRIHLLDESAFPNTPIALGPSLYWDVFAIYRNILDGLGRFSAKYGKPISIGIDTWGATYGFLDKSGRLAEPVFHYRDTRTDGALAAMYQRFPKKEIFRYTGCQCAQSYTLVQLFASAQKGDRILEYADRLLLLPDLLGYFLCGAIATERTIAGTTAMMSADQRSWSSEVLSALSIPSGFLSGDFIDAGSIKGNIRSDVGSELGIAGTPIVAAVSHDSAAAVSAIPDFGPQDLYVSIGTNISMGSVDSVAHLDDAYFEAGFKNTGGAKGSMILYRDFAACWIVNCLVDSWRKSGRDFSFSELDRQAASVDKRMGHFDPDDLGINCSGAGMEKSVMDLLARTGQPLPENEAELIRCVFESIALKVARGATELSRALGRRFTRVRIISGGSRFSCLVSLIAEALGLTVSVGLPSATLVGNALSQFVGLGQTSYDAYGLRSDESLFREVEPKGSGFLRDEALMPFKPAL